MTLSDEIERLDGPSREMDARIAAAIGAKHGQDTGWCDSDNGDYWVVDECAAYYTASLDAAMMLVPEGCSWGITADPHHGAVAYVGGGNRAEAATPALALVAASLRARENG